MQQDGFSFDTLTRDAFGFSLTEDEFDNGAATDETFGFSLADAEAAHDAAIVAPEPPPEEFIDLSGIVQPDDFLPSDAGMALDDGQSLVLQQNINAVGYPWSTVVHISVLWPDGKGAYGSGVMVGRNDVLTAGHVIYSIEHGGYAKDINVVPNFLPNNPTARPYGESTGIPWVDASYPAYGPEVAGSPTATRQPNGAVGYQGSEIDIGLITLRKPLGDYTSWMNLWPGYTSGPLNQTGYPHPYHSETVLFTNDRANAATSRTDSVIDIRAFENYGGNSGGPLWETGADGRAYVAGVVSTGGAMGTDGRGHGGWGADIDANWYKIIAGWITTNDGYIIA